MDCLACIRDSVSLFPTFVCFDSYPYGFLIKHTKEGNKLNLPHLFIPVNYVGCVYIFRQIFRSFQFLN